MKKNQRIVITGGSGFIGSALIDALLRKGYRNLLTISKDRRGSRVHVKQFVSLMEDEARLRKILQPDDTVIHLAWSTTPASAEANPRKDRAENIGGTRALLNACAAKNVRFFIFASSGGTVYGTAHRPLRETTAPRPIGSYGKTKRAAEQLIERYAKKSGTPCAIVRIGNPYGRADVKGRLQGAVDVFLEKIVHGTPIDIWGDGSVVRDYIHVEDVAGLFVRVIEKNLTGIYNAATGVGTTLNALIRIIEKTTGKKARVSYTLGRAIDLPYNVLAIGKAKKEGWKPRYKLQAGIRKTFDALYK